jgi:hypothetical protein
MISSNITLRRYANKYRTLKLCGYCKKSGVIGLFTKNPEKETLPKQCWLWSFMKNWASEPPGGSRDKTIEEDQKMNHVAHNKQAYKIIQELSNDNELCFTYFSHMLRYDPTNNDHDI